MPDSENGFMELLPAAVRFIRCPVNSSDSFFMFLHQIHIVVTHTVYMYN